MLKIPIDVVYKRLEYDESSPSCLRWKIKGGRGSSVKAGDIAGTLDKADNYWRIFIDGKRLKVHRIIWTIFNGEIPDEKIIDHIDRNGSNNKISNLRIVDEEFNARNKSISKRNNTGIGNIVYSEHYNKRETLIRKYTVTVKYNGFVKAKSFSCEKYGKQLAFRLASKARKQLFNEINQLGAGYTDHHGLQMRT